VASVICVASAAGRAGYLAGRFVVVGAGGGFFSARFTRRPAAGEGPKSPHTKRTPPHPQARRG